MSKNLLALVNSFRKKKSLVIGDLILDIYHHGTLLKDSVEGLSAMREANTEVSYGGAGLLVRSILELGGKVTFVTRLGDDAFGETVKAFTHKNLKKFFVIESGRQSVVKERFVVSGKKILKWNYLEDNPLDNAGEKKIIDFVAKHLPSFDKLIISDYRHGLISQLLAKKLVVLSKRAGKPVYLDSQVAQSKSNHHWYKGADLVCLNTKEAKGIDPKFNPKNLKLALKRLSEQLKSLSVIVKLGSKGSAAFLDGHYVRMPAFKVKVKDPTGAGDAFFAVLAVASNPPTKDELKVANIWAALSTTTIGTKLPKIAALKRTLKSSI